MEPERTLRHRWIVRALPLATAVLQSLIAPPRARADAEDPRVDIVARAPVVDTGRGMLMSGYAWLPEGWLPEDRPLRLESAGRRPVATEHRVVSRHADGSARSVRLLGLVGRREWAAGGYLRLACEPPPDPPWTLRCDSTDEAVEVDNGVLRVVFNRAGTSLLGGLCVGGRDLLDGPVAVAAEVGLDTVSSAGEELRAVRAGGGPMSCRVLQSGMLLDRDGLAAGFYRIAWRITVGSPVIEASLRVDGAGDIGIAEDLRLELPLASRRSPAVEVIGAERARLRVGRTSLLVGSLDARRVVAWQDGERARLDPAERGGVSLRGSSGALAVVASRLRHNAPRGLEVRPSGVVSLLAHAGPFFLEGTYRTAVEFALAVGTPRGLARQDAALRAEPLPSLRGEHPRFGRSRDGPEIDATGRLLSIMDEAIDGVSGYLDYGDYRLGDGFANLEYDPARSFLERFIATGDARYGALARDMLHHWVIQDLSRGEMGVPVGFPWMHGGEHRSLEIETGHVWSGGVALGAEVFGDPWLRDAVAALRSALIEVAGDPSRQQNERSFGWLMIALADLHDSEPRAEVARALVEVRRRLLARQHARGWLDLDLGPTGGLFAPTPWVTGGITMEALYRAERIAPDPGARAAMAGMATFLLGDARYADGRYASRVSYSPGLDSQVGRVGVAGRVDLLMIASGLGRASLLGLHEGAPAEFERLATEVGKGVMTARLRPTSAARGLAALRAIEDTRRRIRDA